MAAAPVQPPVAVIGGGAAAISTAIELRKQGLKVVVLHSGEHLGGDDLKSVQVKDGSYVDAGLRPFSFANTEDNALANAVQTMGLETTEYPSSVAVIKKSRYGLMMEKDGVLKLAGSPERAAKILQEQMREFEAKLNEVENDGKFNGMTLSKYLDTVIASSTLSDDYAMPLASGALNMPDVHPDDMNIVDLAKYWKSAGILGGDSGAVSGVQGGMHRFTQAAEKYLVAQTTRFRKNVIVKSVNREDDGDISINYEDAEGVTRVLTASDVVFAGSASDALGLLEDQTPAETAALEAVPEVPARVVVHEDTRFMAVEEDLWGATNYVAPEKDWPGKKPTVTFNLKEFKRHGADYFLTVNPQFEPDEDEVLLDRKDYMRPVANDMAETAARKLKQMQNEKDRTVWFAGAFMEPPFTRDAAWTSGIHTAQIVASSIENRGEEEPSGCCCF